MNLWRLTAVAVCLFSASGWSESAPASAQDRPPLGQPQPSEVVSFDAIDHTAWTELLAKYVDRRGDVDYAKWKASAADRDRLRKYLERLSIADPDLTAAPAARMAFWINAYNAVTIEAILREYPTSSIRNHTAKLFGYNVWDDLPLHVGGTPHSLNQIEHQVLRPMGDPRIHFALVCASRDCPRLRNEAYVADRLEDQLIDNAKHFFAQPRNFAIDDNRLTLSQIMQWYRDDFGADDAAMLARIKPYLDEPSQRRVSGRKLTIRYTTYDWSLNERR